MICTNDIYFLPEGTPLYHHLPSYASTGVAVECLLKDDSKVYFGAYIFDPEDGLWATYHARQVWRNCPSLYPRCTLFGILYKKLQIEFWGEGCMYRVYS